MSGTHIGRLRTGASATRLRFRATPPLNPNLPAGYSFAKKLDFTSSAGWEVREGQVKADGVMRAANVAFAQGLAGDGLVLTGGRATSGGEVAGAEIRGNGGSGKHAIPTNRYTICRLRYDAVVGGIWPAVWERGLSSTPGEIDHFEKFGTTTHANLHTYVGGSVDRNGWRGGLGAFSGTAGGSHTLESLMTPGLFQVWWDGVLANTFTQADYDANATPAGSTSWADQFCTSTSDSKTWQPIFSSQWNDAYGGGIPAGVFTWRLYIDEFKVYVP